MNDEWNSKDWLGLGGVAISCLVIVLGMWWSFVEPLRTERCELKLAAAQTGQDSVAVYVQHTE